MTVSGGRPLNIRVGAEHVSVVCGDGGLHIIGRLIVVSDTDYQSIVAVLESLIPRYIATRLFQAAIESKASEESSRMIAMKNATDNAEDLIEDLTLSYNKIRQANITREMIEIATGAQAR